jgi:EAL domain-containing protein (putative c-di-GMP-specific phosphodiesterase class I)
VGLLSPDQFIPVAEQSGSIRPITAWVLAEALKCCAEWRNEGLPLGVSVNLSAAGIHEVGLADAIACQLEQHQLDPAALAVEVTEGALMRDPNGARATLERLRKLGAKAVIDDFGAGHSSLAYLKNLPVTALKIDRSFLAGGLVDPRDASIVRSTVGLAHNLMLDVVAEGVEDGATLERVSRLGCDEGQGYHIARPMSLPDMKEWLRISPFPAEA